MNSGDAGKTAEALKGLNESYSSAKGSLNPSLLDGNGNTATSGGFASQAEVTVAMSDPRYQKDPAYRAQVMAKLTRSNI